MSTVLSFLAPIDEACAATGFYSDGTGAAIFYVTDGSTSGEGSYRNVGNLNGLNYGEFVFGSDNLLLRGGEAQTFKNDGGNVTGVNQYYRIYLSGNTPGSFTSINLPFSADLGGGNQRWKTTTSNINLLSGLTVSGTYTVQYYWQMFSNQGDHFMSNNGNNYSTTFDLYYDITSGAGNVNTQSATGGAGIFSGNGKFVKRGDGTTQMTNVNSGYSGSTFIDAGTVDITEGAGLGAGAIFIGPENTSGNATLNIGDLNGGTTLNNNLTIRAGGGTRTISGTNTSGVNTYSGGITLNGNATLSAVSGGRVEMSGVISGGSAITKSGSGTVTLSGSSSNSFSGGTTVTAGTLILSKSSSVNALGSGNMTIDTGATVRTDAANQTASQLITVNGLFNMNGNSQQFALAGAGTLQLGNATFTNTNTGDHTFSGKIEGGGSLVKTGTGQLILTNTTSDFTGTTTINGGLLTINNDRALGAVPDSATAGKIVVGAGSLGFSTTMTLDAKRGISLTSANSTLDPFGGATVTYDGIIAGNGTHGLNKAGGGTLILGGDNSYTGLTTVSNGVVRATHANAFGKTDNGVSVVSGAGIELANNITVGSEALTLRGVGLNSAGALRSVSGSNNYDGLITLNGGDTYMGAASGATLKVGAISGGNNALWVVGGGTTILSSGATNTGNNTSTALVKSNNGTVVLVSSNQWNGHEYIRGGTVVVSNNNAFGVSGTTFLGSLTDSENATLRLGSGIINSNSVTIEGGGGGVRTFSFQGGSSTTASQVGGITLNTNSLAFNVATGGTLVFGGTVAVTTDAGGFNRLALDGGGTLLVTNSGSGISSSDRYQVRIGNGTMLIGAGTIISRTNVAGIGHSIDLGVSLSGAQVEQTASLYASNGITVSNSIYVGTTAGDAGRVLGVRGEGAGATFSGPIALADSVLTLDATNGSHIIITGAITNFSGTNALTKTGGGTATLAGENSYNGATTIAGGTLRISGNNRLGNTSSNLTISNAGILQVTAAGAITNPITIGAGNGVLSNSSGGRVVFAGNAVKDGTVLTSRSGAGTNVFTGVISGDNANSDFVVDGGTTIFSNVMTYNGPTIITNGGTLVLGVDDAMPSGSDLILGGGTFRVGVLNYDTDASLQMGTLTLTENSTIDFGDFTLGQGDRILKFADSSNITWTSGKVLTITNWQGVAQTSSQVTQLLFGTGGLSSTNLAQIRFANQNIDGGVIIGLNNELVPVPEPRVYAAAVALLAAVGWRERKRLLGFLGRQ